MEVSKLIEGWKEFINKEYKKELLEKVSRGSLSLNIDFSKLLKYSHEIADLILDDPEEAIKAGEIAIDGFDLTNKHKRFTLRFYNLPPSTHIRIRDIRTEHIGKLLAIDSVIRQTSDIRPQVTSSRYECKSCGNIIAVLQLTPDIKKPTKCGCGGKSFSLVSEEKVDCQRIKIEEPFDSLEGNEQPRAINVLLKNNLTSPKIDKRNTPGSKVIVNAIIKDMPIFSRAGKETTVRDLLLDANYIEQIDEGFGDLNITSEEKKQIIELSKSKTLFDDFVDSYSPDIYGFEEIKLAIVLQLFGGVKKGVGKKARRGDFHILLVGDPSAGKTQLIKYAQSISPKSRYSSGPGTSGKGMTAVVERDEFMGGWMVIAGAMVLAHKGILIADEIDKMTKEDRQLMHESLSEQTVSVDKASIHATLQCETSLLAAGNPKHSRFDEFSHVAEQINLEPSLLSRFDFLFVIKDKPDPKHDQEVIDKILDVHTGEVDISPKIDSELLKKYISYAKQKINPKITDKARAKIKECYLEVRQRAWGNTDKAVPITARQGEGIIRVAEAAAKARLSNKVEESDVIIARDLIMYSLKQIATDPQTGELDVDRIHSTIGHSMRNKMNIVKEIFRKAKDDNLLPIFIDDLIKLCSDKDIKEDETEEIITKLKRYGDILEIKPNKYILGG